MTHQESISAFLKTQSLNTIQRMHGWASQGRMKYCEHGECLLGLSDNGYSRAHLDYESALLAERAEGAFLWLGIDGLDHPLTECGSDEQRNRLMVPILEAELLRRELENVAVSSIQEEEEAVYA